MLQNCRAMTTSGCITSRSFLDALRSGVHQELGDVSELTGHQAFRLHDNHRDASLRSLVGQLRRWSDDGKRVSHAERLG